MTGQRHLGNHITLDLYDCDSTLLDSCDFIEATLTEVARLMNLSVVAKKIHRFSPIGVSGVLIIEESHVSVHTWPEHRFAAIDFFTYEDMEKIDEGIKWLQKELKSARFTKKAIVRGELAQINNLVS